MQWCAKIKRDTTVFYHFCCASRQRQARRCRDAVAARATKSCVRSLSRSGLPDKLKRRVTLHQRLISLISVTRSNSTKPGAPNDSDKALPQRLFPFA